MFPIKDNIPCRTTPVMNYAVIVITSAAFLMQLAEPAGGPSLVEEYGMIPSRITDPSKEVTVVVEQGYVMTPLGPQLQQVTREAAPAAVPAILTMVTCVFLHGGWMHFLGNMWFLHIFGDNVEDRLGHVGYLAFYLVGGALASLVHLLSEPGSTVPTIGASGAIAAVMGAYFVWYPHAHIKAIVPIFIVLYPIVLPAAVFLGIWFLIQFFQGAASISGTQAAGVAWWAHVGGFGAGYLIAGLLGRTHAVRETNPARRADVDSLPSIRFRRPR
ncbi:MAG: rhomboid family intramembrane serine protease [Planctomyces sp.]|nr:rhomboid family intramembrane serine protease [Planctomyces sp.]